MDLHRIQQAVERVLLAIGEDPQREGLRDTPRRVAQMYAEVFAGLTQDPVALLAGAFEEDVGDQAVVARDLSFWSMCEHHLLPFFGKAQIAYVPAGRVAGVSKLARALDALAWRPQLQERLTAQLADAVHQALRPQGVAVVVEAEHLCMVMRGVKKPGSAIVTSAVRGDFQTGALSREELLALLLRR